MASKQSAFKFASAVELVGHVTFIERKKVEELTIETMFVQMTDIVTDGKEIKNSIKVIRFIQKNDLKTTNKPKLKDSIHVVGRLRRNSWKPKGEDGKPSDTWKEEWTVVASQIDIYDDEEIDYSDLPF